MTTRYFSSLNQRSYLYVIHMFLFQIHRWMQMYTYLQKLRYSFHDKIRFLFLFFYNQKEFWLQIFYFEYKWLSSRYTFQVKTSLQSNK